MPENINVEVLFFNDRAVGVTLPNFIEQAIVADRARASAATPDRRDQARQDLHRRADQRAAVHQRRRRHQDRHAHGRVPRAPRARLGRDGPRSRGGCAARRWRRGRAILRAVRGLVRSGRGSSRSRRRRACRSPGQEVHLDAIPAGRRRRCALADHVARVPHEAAGRGRATAHRPDLQGAGAPRSGPAPPAASSRWSSGTARTRRSRRSPTTARRWSRGGRARRRARRRLALGSPRRSPRTTVRELAARARRRRR